MNVDKSWSIADAPLVLTGRKVLIIVQNLPVPFDRRVWQEARALRQAGAEVTVICPMGKGAQERDTFFRSSVNQISCRGSMR